MNGENPEDRRGREAAAAEEEPEATTRAPGSQTTQLLFGPPPLAEQERMVEAILFGTAGPMTRAEIAERLPEGSAPAEALALLEKRYQGRGVRLVRVGQAWAFRTAPDLGFLMHREVRETKKLSRAGIETLAIIAYHQPVTRAEIEEIRGVTISKGTLDILLDLGWIRLGRRRDTPGRPATFMTTQGFLDHFGLASARDLPGLKELREAGLLDSTPPDGSEETAGEDIGPDMFGDEPEAR